MLPSGEYFLGRPLFFLAESEGPKPQGFKVVLSLLLLKGSEGGGGLLLLNGGNRAVAGAIIDEGFVMLLGKELGPTITLGG